MRSLIVDDEAPARRRLRRALETLPAITAISECSGGREAVDAIVRTTPDIAFLDVEMPVVGGIAIATAVRGLASTAVVFVTAHDQYAVSAFDVAALDYLLKPVDDARVAEAVRRAAAYLTFARATEPRSVDRFGDVTVDFARHEVAVKGQRVDLRPKEYELLVALLRRGGVIASREDLLREVWGYADGVVSRTVDTHIGELRRHLEEDPARPVHILTARHYGYRLTRH